MTEKIPTAAEAAEAFGLIGSWSPDWTAFQQVKGICVSFKVETDGSLIELLQTQHFKGAVVLPILSATLLSDERIEMVIVPRSGKPDISVLQKFGDKFRFMETRSVDGKHAHIVNGRYTHSENGDETPLFEKHPDE